MQLVASLFQAQPQRLHPAPPPMHRPKLLCLLWGRCCAEHGGGRDPDGSWGKLLSSKALCAMIFLPPGLTRSKDARGSRVFAVRPLVYRLLIMRSDFASGGQAGPAVGKRGKQRS